MSDCGCVDEVDICIIRGDTFEQVCSLNDGWPEVLASPSSYSFTMVIRDDQSDAQAPRLTMTGVDITLIVTTPVTPITGPRLYFTFRATSDQTQALPDWDLVGYVEIRATSGAVVERLANLRVHVED